MPPPRWRARGARRRRRRRRRREIGARRRGAARAPPWTRPPRSPPRAPELGFYEAYEAGAGTAAEPDARSDGFWLDSEVLVDAPEAVARGLVSATASTRRRRRASARRAGFRRRLRSSPPRFPRSRRRCGSPSRRARPRSRASPSTAWRCAPRRSPARATSPRRAPRAISRRGARRAGRSCSRWRSAEVSSPAAPSSRPRAGRCAGSCARRSRGWPCARARRARVPGTRASGREGRARFRARVQPGDLRLRRVGSRNRARDLPRRAVAEPSARGRRRRGRPGRGLERGRGAGGGRAQGAARALLQARDGGAGRGAENRRAQRARRGRQRSLKCTLPVKKNGVFFFFSFVPRKPARSRAVASDCSIYAFLCRVFETHGPLGTGKHARAAWHVPDARVGAMELDDVADDGAPVIASLPMGGGAVRGPGAGKLCVRWGLGNELQIVRARGPANAAGADANDPGTSQGAAYVVQWCV